MGLVRLRDKDLKLARDSRYRDEALDRSWRGQADDLLERWEAEARSMGYRVLPKTSFFGPRFAKMSTAYYKQIRLGTGYSKKTTFWKCVTFGHEIFHGRQWRGFGRRRFRTRYLFWTRWRWAIEVQAYAESVRILVALGADYDTIRDYIARRPDVLWKNYAIKSLRREDVYAYTLLVLQDAHEEAERRVGG